MSKAEDAWYDLWNSIKDVLIYKILGIFEKIKPHWLWQGGMGGGYMKSITFNGFFNGGWSRVKNSCCCYFCCCFVGIFWARSKGWVNICWQNRKKSGCHKGIRCFSLTQMLSPKKSCDLQYQRPQQWFFKL